MYETHAGATLVRTGYGNLEKIIALRVSAVSFLFFGPLREKMILVALVKPWDTDGKVASKSSVFFKTSKARIIMDLRSLKAVVGLVKTRGKWGIINRMPGTTPTCFADDMMTGGPSGEHKDDELNEDNFIL